VYAYMCVLIWIYRESVCSYGYIERVWRRLRCVCICICVFAYIGIQEEREWLRLKCVCICIRVCAHMAVAQVQTSDNKSLCDS